MLSRCAAQSYIVVVNCVPNLECPLLLVYQLEVALLVLCRQLRPPPIPPAPPAAARPANDDTGGPSAIVLSKVNGAFSPYARVFLRVSAPETGSAEESTSAGVHPASRAAIGRNRIINFAACRAIAHDGASSTPTHRSDVCSSTFAPCRPGPLQAADRLRRAAADRAGHDDRCRGRRQRSAVQLLQRHGNDPPVIVLGIEQRPTGAPKDTVRNIRATKEFVVNLVDEAIADPMNVCAIDFRRVSTSSPRRDSAPRPRSPCGRRASPRRPSPSSASCCRRCRSARQACASSPSARSSIAMSATASSTSGAMSMRRSSAGRPPRRQRLCEAQRPLCHAAHRLRRLARAQSAE